MSPRELTIRSLGGKQELIKARWNTTIANTEVWF